MAELGDLVEQVYAQAGMMLGSMSVDQWSISVGDMAPGDPEVILRVVIDRGRGNLREGRRVNARWRVRSAGSRYTKWVVRERLRELREVLTG